LKLKSLLKRWKKYLSSIGEITAELIAAGIYDVLRSINLFILFEIRRDCQRNGRDLLLYLFIKTAIKLIKEEYHIYQIQNFIKPSCLKFNSICRRKYRGSSVWNLTLTDHLLIRDFVFVRWWRITASVMGNYSSYLQSSRKLMTETREKYCVII
jgi:hypothetical protein